MQYDNNYRLIPLELKINKSIKTIIGGNLTDSKNYFTFEYDVNNHVEVDFSNSHSTLNFLTLPFVHLLIHDDDDHQITFLIHKIDRGDLDLALKFPESGNPMTTQNS